MPPTVPKTPRVWNPFSARAWYWRGRHGQLHRWWAISFLGHVGLVALTSLVLLIPGCRRSYDLVKGSGKPKAMMKQVKIQKVHVEKKKRVLVNPNSTILFHIPDVDSTPLQLKEITANEYKIGQGDGDGPPGYAAGKAGAKFLFIRVSTKSGDWDLNLRNGADANLIKRFGQDSRMPVSPLSIDVPLSEIDRYKAAKAPPVVFLTGSKAFSFEAKDPKRVRSYLLDNHGMIFADHGGNQFHNVFMSLMRAALPEVQPVAIPDDDPVYQAPHYMDGCPPLWAHNGTQALGWKKNGRWVCFYHQGAITDAWKDNHGGTSAESAELAYRLGVNILAQAMASYSEWVLAQRGGK